MSNRRALINGAGIAGPALAYWLDRFGWDVTVTEIADGIRTGGQTVDLRGAGRTVIERMGLMPRARELALEQHGIAWIDRHGNRRAEMPVDLFDGDGIISEIEIQRGDLAGCLYEETAGRVNYWFGQTVSALEDCDDRVSATYGPRGESHATEEFDLVVGADGPHSTVRRLAFGSEAEYVRPLGGYMSWFSAPDDMGEAGWYLMYNEPGGLNASIRRPADRFGATKAGLSFASHPLDYDRADLSAQRALIADRFARARGIAPALVDAMGHAEDCYLDGIVQVRMDRWSRGRVALVGDAGYCPSPLTGLGTSLGLVGAYVLAGELATAGDVATGLERYEQRLRPYVRPGQQLPPGGIAGYVPRTRAGLELGLLATKAMMARPVRPLMKKTMFGKADAIVLPDYGSVEMAAG